ncbi:MAG: protein kinase [Bacteroidota bacterium]
MIGQTISHYTILEKLGEGGMGIVYKAQDTTLNRTIALKFLPDRVTKDETSKARFLQEAQAAAGLNHPNICTIFGVEEHDGQLFISMEYIEGGTLREKVPFAKTDDAITIAIQIGDALQEAHAKGIVHRDIKADNIMLTSKGQAKVMDFGLAKLKGVMKLTRTSSTVGTLGYMAPEQIQGGEVDQRSDIFSFGVLLFEMLTGKLPFRGEHEAAMVYSIVNEDPQDITQLLPDLSPIVVNLIQRCLEKDPNDRYQHFDDIVADLRRSQKKTSRIMRSSAYTPVRSSADQPISNVPLSSTISTAIPAKKNPMRMYVMIGGGTLVVAAVVWFVLLRSSASLNPDMTTKILQVPFTQYSYAGISPDGNWIAFPAADASGKWDIYFMNVNGGDSRKITSDATSYIGQSADISPDGSQVIYNRLSDDGKTDDIFVISALGGASRKVATRGEYPLWRHDGKRIGFIRTSNGGSVSESGKMEFWTVQPDGLDARREFIDTLFVTKGNNYRYSFCWSPDGNSIAWIRSLSSSSQVVIIHNLKTGDERQITNGKENIDSMVWTVDGFIIFSTNRGGNTNLWAIPASGGNAFQITKGGGPDIGISTSYSGRSLVYLQQQPVGNLWRANVDGSSLRQISFDERNITEPSFSPDKKHIAFVMNDPDPLTRNSNVFVMDRDGNNRRQLTSGSPNIRFPRWSPDGKRISYIVLPTGQGADTGKPKIYIVDADNPGVPTFTGNYFGVSWLDDNHILTVDGVRSYIVTVSPSQTRRFFTDSVTVWGLYEGKRLLVYDRRKASTGWWIVDINPTTADELTKQPGDVIMPVIKGNPKKIGNELGFAQLMTSALSQNGLVMQYAENDQLREMSIVDSKEKIIPTHFPGIDITSTFDLSKDGSEIVFVAPRLSSRLVLLENVFK